jgi:3-oxoadipate enol-lactonase
VPFISINNLRLFYRLEGRSELPVLVLSHSLGCDLGMWDPQMPDLLEHFRVLRYDTRGHGASDVPSGEYSIHMLGSDVVNLCSALHLQQFAFCGISMGGAVGQWLALNAPERLSGLVLANTSPKFGTRETWDARLQAVREGGMAAVSDAVLERFFSPESRAGVWGQSVRAVLLGTNPKGYAGCCVALRDVNYTDAVGCIKTPTLIIGSDQDPSTPWETNGEVLAHAIPGAKAVVLRGAHLSNLEGPRSFTAALIDFLLRSDDAGGNSSRN